MNNQLAFRVYSKIGCPFCEGVKGFLWGKGVAFDTVEIDNDPIAYNGIKAMFGEVQLPVVLSFRTEQAVCGYKPEAYEKLVADSIARDGASAPHLSGGQQPDIQAGAGAAIAETTA